jgi:hypothetical protein
VSYRHGHILTCLHFFCSLSSLLVLQLHYFMTLRLLPYILILFGSTRLLVRCIRCCPPGLRAVSYFRGPGTPRSVLKWIHITRNLVWVPLNFRVHSFECSRWQ